jgi:hypothetical protein
MTDFLIAENAEAIPAVLQALQSDADFVRQVNVTLHCSNSNFSVVGLLAFVEFVRRALRQDFVQPGIPLQLLQLQQKQSLHKVLFTTGHCIITARNAAGPSSRKPRSALRYFTS